MRVGLTILILSIALLNSAFSLASENSQHTYLAIIEMEDLSRMKEALHMLEQSKDLSDTLLWALGKGYLLLGDSKEGADRLFFYEKGLYHTTKALEQNPLSPEAHFWHTSLIGRMGQARGVLQSLAVIKPIRDGYERVLELDPNYGDALLALSTLYRLAPGRPLSIGSPTRSLDYGLRAWELEPTNHAIRMNLAQAHILNRNYNEARDLLVAIQEELNASPEHKAYEEASALLHSIRNR